MFMMYFIHNVFTTCFGRYYGHLQGYIIIIIIIIIIITTTTTTIITRIQMYNVVSCVAVTP